MGNRASVSSVSEWDDVVEARDWGRDNLPRFPQGQSAQRLALFGRILGDPALLQNARAAGILHPAPARGTSE